MTLETGSPAIKEEVRRAHDFDDEADRVYDAFCSWCDSPRGPRYYKDSGWWFDLRKFAGFLRRNGIKAGGLRRLERVEGNIWKVPAEERP